MRLPVNPLRGKTTNRRAGCEKFARPVRREGGPKPIGPSYPYQGSFVRRLDEGLLMPWILVDNCGPRVMESSRCERLSLQFWRWLFIAGCQVRPPGLSRTARV